MSSAPSGDHLAPVMPNLSSMTNLQAPFDHAGGDRPSLFECLVVAHVLVVVLQVGDGPVHVSEIKMAGPGVRAGLRGDGGQGGGDGFRAAVQDAEQLPNILVDRVG